MPHERGKDSEPCSCKARRRPLLARNVSIATAEGLMSNIEAISTKDKPSTPLYHNARRQRSGNDSNARANKSTLSTMAK